MTHRQRANQAARERYGLRHLHWVRAKINGVARVTQAATLTLQYYLRTAQKYYPHI